MSYLCGIGSYMCGFPTPKRTHRKAAVNAIPKEITKKEILAAFGATNHTEINQRSPIEKNSIKNPDGIEILKAFGAII